MAYTYDPNASLAAKMAALEQLWTDAGGSAALAPEMAAIAVAESGGDPSGVCYDYTGADGKTHCSSTPIAGASQVDVGLWGIANVHLPAGSSPQALLDPATNAKYAVALAGPTGAGIASAWAAEFVPGSSGANNYQKSLAAAGASVAGAVGFIVGDQTPGSTVLGQNLSSSAPAQGTAVTNRASNGSEPTTTTPAGFWAPLIAAASAIATETFVGALALALISGGILWLASTDSAVRATAAKAIAA